MREVDLFVVVRKVCLDICYAMMLICFGEHVGNLGDPTILGSFVGWFCPPFELSITARVLKF